MPISIRAVAVAGCLAAVVSTISACSPHHVIAPATVNDLIEDRVMLDGVLLKCSKDLSKAHNEADCVNARIAIQRLASQTEAGEQEKRAAEFERTRERWRVAQDKQFAVESTKVDAYHLPLIPAEPPPAPPAFRPQVSPAPPESPGGASPPVARQASN